LPDDYSLERYKTHTIEVVMDRFILKRSDAVVHRLEEGITKALKRSGGYIVVLRQLPNKRSDRWEELHLSQHLACLPCDLDFGELAPRSFSFNSPYGACKTCNGTGLVFTPELNSFIKEPTLPVDKAIAGFKWLLWGRFDQLVPLLAEGYGLDVSKAWETLPAWQQNLWLYGQHPDEGTLTARVRQSKKAQTARQHPWVQEFDGLTTALLRELTKPSNTQTIGDYWHQFVTQTTCHACHGDRLNPFALHVCLEGTEPTSKPVVESRWTLSFKTLLTLSIDQLSKTLSHAWLALPSETLTIAHSPLEQVLERLNFLHNVGLGYLNLGRAASTLSGGEAQRIRLASQLGSGLSGVLVVLDEPSIGLHPYNNDQLIDTLRALRDKGNTVLVVEHDEDMIRAADHVIEIGPLAGQAGGHVIYSGTVAGLMQQHGGPSSNTEPNTPLTLVSPTAQFLTHARCLPVQLTPRTGLGKQLILTGVQKHNLNQVTLTLPLGQLVGITGLSGSGKSTLVFDCLEPLVQQWLSYSIGGYGRRKKDVHPSDLPLPEGITSVEGLEHIERMIVVDQSPIGKTSRSNPATYTGMFDQIRAIFSNTFDAKRRGLSTGAFSFNVKGGRCEACQGLGDQVLSLGMLPDATTPCSECHGQRYNPDVLAVRYKAHSIADVLNLPIQEAAQLFEDHTSLAEKLQLLCDVGLGYLRVGQSSSTLSGGEAQRLKLATELMRKQSTHTLYLLDEPSVGLHWHDLELLLTLFNRLVEAGHTVVFIEHHLDLIAACDTLIDLGPYGGDAGGDIVVAGSVSTVCEHPTSLTGRYLKRLLAQRVSI
jgi:excinuclease ABC subunit A